MAELRLMEDLSAEAQATSSRDRFVAPTDIQFNAIRVGGPAIFSSPFGSVSALQPAEGIQHVIASPCDLVTEGVLERSVLTEDSRLTA